MLIDKIRKIQDILKLVEKEIQESDDDFEIIGQLLLLKDSKIQYKFTFQ